MAADEERLAVEAINPRLPDIVSSLRDGGNPWDQIALGMSKLLPSDVFVTAEQLEAWYG